jgi:hypothetical protein
VYVIAATVVVIIIIVVVVVVDDVVVVVTSFLIILRKFCVCYNIFNGPQPTKTKREKFISKLLNSTAFIGANPIQKLTIQNILYET